VISSSKKYLFAAIFFLAIGLGYALFLYFKPVEKISASKADIEVTATDLLKEFEKDQAAADTKYKGKVLLLNGNIHKIENTGANAVLYFDEQGKYIITAGMQGLTDKLPAAGQEVVIKGLYSGVIVNDEMFMIPADIKLEQCTIAK